MSHLRLSQTVLSVLLAAYGLLVALTNLLDYAVNFEFVRMVAGMSDTFDALKAARSVQHPVLLHGTYALIIAAEAGSGLFCARGAWRMWRARHAPGILFESAKGSAVKGVLLGLALWFGAFVVVGGEWFMMWQSKTWNAQATAFSLSVFYALVLLVLLKKDEL
ncbi:MAG: DUF2165 domain-containing protein [Thermoanaerobaculia bacterium]|nr:DUF2165 domain-containing protein [Thermoanaerobaculia bacterium]